MGELSERVAAVRRFNRFYTREIGVLDRGYLESRFSLTEVRVLYELAHRGDETSASELSRDLGIDAGYLSRIIDRFRRRGLLRQRRAQDDGRRLGLALTDRGSEAIAPLEERARSKVAALLERATPKGQRRLVAAMSEIERALRESDEHVSAVRLRPLRSGDLGWVVERHGALYHEEYGWDERFEALVARIVADFVDHLDGARERGWVAELDGERVGSVFCVKKTKTVAKLRLLLVEPRARGRGIGARLVDQCIGFARAAGYRELVLWTNDVLVAARRLYERAGFALIASEPHESFGKKLIGENWSLRL